MICMRASRRAARTLRRPTLTSPARTGTGGPGPPGESRWPGHWHFPGQTAAPAPSEPVSACCIYDPGDTDLHPSTRTQLSLARGHPSQFLNLGVMFQLEFQYSEATPHRDWKGHRLGHHPSRSRTRRLRDSVSTLSRSINCTAQ